MPSGKPIAARSQSIVTSSTCVAPGDPTQEPPKTLWPAATKSATTAAKLLGPGT